jgi:hypothetical protein
MVYNSIAKKERRVKMDTNSIILELLSRIKVLENKVEVLEKKLIEEQKEDLNKSKKPAFPVEKISDKYRALAEYLYESWEKKIVLTYAEIENILTFKLPSTAYNLPRTYWANTLTHTYATSWMLVGYKTKVNISDMSVTFEKIIY